MTISQHTLFLWMFKFSHLDTHYLQCTPYMCDVPDDCIVIRMCQLSNFFSWHMDFNLVCLYYTFFQIITPSVCASDWQRPYSMSDCFDGINFFDHYYRSSNIFESSTILEAGEKKSIKNAEKVQNFNKVNNLKTEMCFSRIITYFTWAYIICLSFNVLENFNAEN